MNLREKGIKSKKRLLKAAQKCFAKYGYDATGVAKICEYSGLSKGAFYHHFSSKQELFLEMMNLWLKILDRYIDTIKKESSNIPQLVMNIASKARPIFLEAEGQLPIFIELWIKASRDKRLRKTTIVSYQKYLKLFRGIIDEGIQKGSIRKVNPDIISRMIVAVAVGLMMQGLLDPEGADWDKVAKESTEVMIRGLTKL
jgi:TetR/AcrR family transcriptional repressor of uid operon